MATTQTPLSRTNVLYIRIYLRLPCEHTLRPSRDFKENKRYTQSAFGGIALGRYTSERDAGEMMNKKKREVAPEPRQQTPQIPSGPVSAPAHPRSGIRTQGWLDRMSSRVDASFACAAAAFRCGGASRREFRAGSDRMLARASLTGWITPGVRNAAGAALTAASALAAASRLGCIFVRITNRGGPIHGWLWPGEVLPACCGNS